MLLLPLNEDEELDDVAFDWKFLLGTRFKKASNVRRKIGSIIVNLYCPFLVFFIIGRGMVNSSQGIIIIRILLRRLLFIHPSFDQVLHQEQLQ